MSDATNDWIAKLEAADKRDLARLSAAKAKILAALKRTRVALISIEYDGEGDSGQISSIGATTAQAKPAKLPKGPFSLKLDDGESSYTSFAEALDAFAWTVLRLYHAGFENNEGGFGTIVIAVGIGKVLLNHNDRVIELCNSVTEV